MEPPLGKYFLSYSHSDQETALRIATDLRQSGAEIWVDQMDIRPSDRWDQAVENALKDSLGVLLIMSPHSVSSENVLDEISFALDAGKNVIPLLVSPCKLPLRLARIQFIDATRDYDAALARCRQAMAFSHSSAEPGAPSPQPAMVVRETIPAAFTANFLDALARSLTPFMGPVARLLIEDETRNASNEEDLIARVAARIPAADQKRSFLLAAQALRRT